MWRDLKVHPAQDIAHRACIEQLLQIRSQPLRLELRSRHDLGEFASLVAEREKRDQMSSGELRNGDDLTHRCLPSSGFPRGEAFARPTPERGEASPRDSLP